MFAAVTTIVAALALAGCSGSERPTVDHDWMSSEKLPAKTTEALGDALDKAITLSGATGALAGVWIPGVGSWTASPGRAGSGGASMSTAMHFRIGENTRAMTCTVLLALVDEGTVKLDDTVSKYVPRVVGANGVTLRQLCQSTSGLGGFRSQLEERFVNDPERHYFPLELVSTGLGANRTGAPGKNWASSDTGFVLLGMALENATDKSWQELYERYIFRPLGLTGTSYPDGDDTSLPSPHPTGYAYAVDTAGNLKCDDRRNDTEFSPSAMSTAGGVVSTVKDLGTFAYALARGDLVSTDAAKEQWTTVQAYKADWKRYGLGAVQYGPMRGEAGAVPGFLSAMFSDPDSGLTVVVALNNSSAGAGFARLLAMQLTAIAADASTEKKVELPWTQKDAASGLTSFAVCQEKPKKDDEKD